MWKPTANDPRKLECSECEAVFKVGAHCACPIGTGAPVEPEKVDRSCPSDQFSADQYRRILKDLSLAALGAVADISEAKTNRKISRAQAALKGIDLCRRVVDQGYRSAVERETVAMVERAEELVDRLRTRHNRYRPKPDAILAPKKPTPKPEEN